LHFRIVVCFIVLTFCLDAFSQLNSRWKELMGVVDQEMEMLKKSGKSPRMEFRQLELNSEKLKLIHELNNFQFLEAIKKNSKQDKQFYFRQSQEQYKKTKDFGITLLKNNPRHPYNAQIAMTLGFISRDYGHDGQAEKYLALALKLFGNSQSELKKQTEAALAEYYFNEKKFSQAEAMYEKLVPDVSSPWLSKNLFNLAWCKLKLNKLDSALVLMKKAYQTSQSPKYINVSDQVNESLGSFYIIAGRPLEAMSFYIENNKDPLPLLMKLGSKVNEKGYAKETEIILNTIREKIRKTNQTQYREELLHYYLDFYRKYSRFHEHYLISKEVTALYLSNEKRERSSEAVEKMRSAAGYLQVILLKDRKKNSNVYSPEKAKLIQKYFNLLIQFNPQETANYFYLKGESYYSIDKYKAAVAAYMKAISHAKKTNQPELARKPLNSLLVLSGQGGFSPSEEQRILIFAYKYHISFWPKDEKSRQIYPKLFSIYQQSGQDKKAAGVLVLYNRLYPEDLKIQQRLMTDILDILIEKKDTRKLTYWSHKLKTGFLSLDKKTIHKTEEALSNLFFLEYQNLAKAGKHQETLQGFAKIYNQKDYSPDIRAQSANFAAMTSMELGNVSESYNWQLKADKLMDSTERLKQRQTRLQLAERSYQLQDFGTAFKISEPMLNAFCSLKDGVQNRFFEIALMTSLVENKPNVSEGILNTYSKCLSSNESNRNALVQIFQYYDSSGDLSALTKLTEKYKSAELTDLLLHSLRRNYWSSDVGQKKKILSLLNSTELQPLKIWFKELNDYAQAVQRIEILSSQVIWSSPTFDPELFNKSLESHILQHQEFKSQFQSLTESTDVELVVLSSRVFADLFARLGAKISSLHPQNMDPNTFSGFQKVMQRLGSDFSATSAKYIDQLKKSLSKNETLSWVSRSEYKDTGIYNPISSKSGLLMDMLGDKKP
jgi:hypothetical protein